MLLLSILNYTTPFFTADIIVSMSRIVEINGINYASTGNIAINIGQEAEKAGYETYLFFRNSKEGKKRKTYKQQLIGFWLDKVISERLAYIFGLNGYFNVINTFWLTRKLDKIKPDLIHLHSLCDSFLNIDMLFNYIIKNDIPVIWTLHDNWPFTGRCAQNRCSKWQEGCGNCPHYDYYPGTLFLDNSKAVLQKRKKLYNRLKNLTIVTPSKWLGNLVTKSIFGTKYDIEVINNGIDLDIFKPVESDFREKYNLKDKIILLGVAYYWDESKGLDVFIELSKRLPDNYQIVLVGTNDEVDKLLPDNIISIHRTSSREELVKIYSSADLFVNPTRDENYPTVNMESIACGTPVLTFDTGGCAEIISEKTGASVETGDTDKMYEEIIRICENSAFKKEDCIEHSKNFNMEDKYKEYVSLYKKILG